MIVRPINSNGTLRLSNGQWSITLETDDATFADGMKVRVVLWDDRSVGSRSEVEQIAIQQQLEPSIVALALSAEGAFADKEKS